MFWILRQKENLCRRGQSKPAKPIAVEGFQQPFSLELLDHVFFVCRTTGEAADQLGRELPGNSCEKQEEVRQSTRGGGLSEIGQCDTS